MKEHTERLECDIGTDHHGRLIMMVMMKYFKISIIDILKYYNVMEPR